jgi:hypothetical protein
VQALEDVTPWTHRHDVGGTRPSAVATNEHPSPGPVPPGRSPTGRNNP